MGGLNALRFAGTWPARVRALVLVDVGTGARLSASAPDLRPPSSPRRPRSPGP
ncbi:MAG: hypothetical protein JRG96_20675 [Deltaproteobacteria bacterium]|nr:hypothetical protein [Deltaproteobacteria bacterium]